MSVGKDFEAFCSNLTINNRSSIAERYQLITRRLNLDFWNLDSKTIHSFYAGSYGRGTARRNFSDLDMVFQLPLKYYITYNNYVGNGQSALLQAVRRSVQETYPSTRIGGDGQVVLISFADGIKFEVVPGFLNPNGSYTYPDSNDGGKWRITNPKPEIRAIFVMDAVSKGNLKRLCRMTRAWKTKWSVPMGGLLIDTLAHRFIKSYRYKTKSFFYYDWMSRDFFKFLADEPEREYWLAIGSKQYVWTKGKFQSKARQCYLLAQKAIDYQSKDLVWSSRQQWREIYGTAYPST